MWFLHSNRTTSKTEIIPKSYDVVKDLVRLSFGGIGKMWGLRTRKTVELECFKWG